jgi:hypothetical protein
MIDAGLNPCFSADSAPLRVIDWFDYDYEHDYEHEHEHGQDRIDSFDIFL